MSSLSVTTLARLAQDVAEKTEPAIHPYVVGGVSLGVLLAALLALIMFGAGREHS